VGRARSPIANAIARAVTSFGAVPAVAGVSLAAVVVCRKRPRLALQVAAGAVAGIAAELGVKRLFLRERPTLLEHLEPVRPVKSTAFPSGHAMASSALYLTLAFVGSKAPRLRAMRAALLTSAGALSALIGGTRVYLGVHWPTDVLGGLALGTAWACLAEATFDIADAKAIERRGIGTPA
jgi:undecaprenyl-diphosphatase